MKTTNLNQRTPGRTRLAILDERVNYHVMRFVTLEEERMQLHARSQHLPPEILQELVAIERRLDQLRAGLQ